MTEKTESSPLEASSSSDQEPAENPSEVKVRITPALAFWGLVAIILGIGSGLVMSSATFFK